VALVQGLAGSVQARLDETVERIAPKQADTAIFYSISNCQKGLRGVSFGNFLIKQVVSELRKELRNLTTFSTLSPVPGFRRWLDQNHADDPALKILAEPDWVNSAAKAEALRQPLMRLCAKYLVGEKQRERPLDSVARFHLGNGARLERINWMGDVSAKGVEESASLLVNYKYDLTKIESNHEAYVNSGRVVHSKQVEGLLEGLDEFAK